MPPSPGTVGQRCQDRRNNFDFIRFVAASLVIYSHAFPLSRGNAGELLKDLTNEQWSFGALAVSVFFIISGFLIARSYDRGGDPLKFIKARLLRILPGLFVVLLLSAFVLGPLVTTLTPGEYFRSGQTYTYLKTIFLSPVYWELPGVFQSNIFSPSVNGSLWTIPFEMLFYGLVLLLGLTRLLRRRKLNLALFLGFLFLEAFKTRLYPDGGSIFGLPLYSFIELGLDFSLGMLVWAYRDSIPLDRHYAMLALALLTGCVLCGSFAIPFALCGGYLIFYLALGVRADLSGFTRRGDLSYGLYIYGFPVQQTVTWAFGGAMDPYINMLISFPVTVLLAWGSWHLVEGPCLRLKDRTLLKRPPALPASLARLSGGYDRLLDRLSNFGWAAFLLCAVAAGALLYAGGPGRQSEPVPTADTALDPAPTPLDAPTLMTFPTENEEALLSGWHAQQETEAYRWVSQVSRTRLPTLGGQTTALYISGYVPESFTEVARLRVYIDDVLAGECDVTPGASLTLDLPAADLALGEEAVVRLEFNAQHFPAEGAQDSRIMSAMIQKIGFH